MKKKKVLLVDDVQFFLDQQKDILEREDFELIFARSGSQAIRIAEEEVPDLIMMDLYMPDMDGDECCRVIKSVRELQDVPIVMITSGSVDGDFERCWQAGCNEIVLKPINTQYFYAVIRKYLPVKLRAAPRYAARLRVQYGADQKQLLEEYSINLSTGGLFIETSNLLEVDSRLTLSFSVSDDVTKIRCEGRVAWVNHPETMVNKNLPAGMGIQFVGLSLEDLDSIRGFIKSHTLLPIWQPQRNDLAASVRDAAPRARARDGKSEQPALETDMVRTFPGRTGSGVSLIS